MTSVGVAMRVTNPFYVYYLWWPLVASISMVASTLVAPVSMAAPTLTTSER